MRARALLFVVFSISCGGSSDDPAAPAARHPGCERVCELDAAYCISVSDVAQCKRSCGNIDRLLDAACADATDAFFDCIANTPLDELTCDDSNDPAPVDGSCEDELAVVTACAK